MKPRRTVTSPLALLLGLVLAVVVGVGCAPTVSVKTDVAPGTNFAAYRTFSQTAPPKASRGLPGYSEISGSQIQSAIADSLVAKGFQPAAEESADLVVTFSVDGQPRQDVTWSGGGYDAWYGNTYTVNYTEGTLTIDIFDAKKKKLVWHAYGQTDLFGTGYKTSQVDKAVATIMKGFPPQ